MITSGQRARLPVPDAGRGELEPGAAALRRQLDAEAARLHPPAADRQAGAREIAVFPARRPPSAEPESSAGEGRGKTRNLPVEEAIVDRYVSRGGSLEEALLEIYYANLSLRGVEEIAQALWPERVSPGTIATLRRYVAERLGEWRRRAIHGSHAYVYAAEIRGGFLMDEGADNGGNVRVVVGVDEEGFRDVLAVGGGTKPGIAGWTALWLDLVARGLRGVRLIVGDGSAGLRESVAAALPGALHQCCVKAFGQDIVGRLPPPAAQATAPLLRAIHGCSDRATAGSVAARVVEQLIEWDFPTVAARLAASVADATRYFEFPRQHWCSLRTAYFLTEVGRDIRERNRVIGSRFDADGAVNVVTARLRFAAATTWSIKGFMDMRRLDGVGAK